MDVQVEPARRPRAAVSGPITAAIDKEALSTACRRTLLPASLIYTYDVPPASMLHNLELKFQVKQGGPVSDPVTYRLPPQRCSLGGAPPSTGAAPSLESNAVTDETDDPGADEDGQVAHVRIKDGSHRTAGVSFELRADSKEISQALPPGIMDARQQAILISSPHWFVDRSGLGLEPVSHKRDRLLLEGGVEHVYVLDETPETHQLEIRKTFRVSNPATLEQKPMTFYSGKIEFPQPGGFCDVAVQTASYYHTLCLRSEKISVSGTGGAPCKLLTIVPKFLVTNLLDVPICLKQAESSNAQAALVWGGASSQPVSGAISGGAFSSSPSGVSAISANNNTPTAILRVEPFRTRALFWSNKKGPYHFVFAPSIADTATRWSSPIVCSEDAAGESYMSLNVGDRHVTFIARIVPDSGCYSVAIRLASSVPLPLLPSGVFVVNGCAVAAGVSVVCRTFHELAARTGGQTAALQMALAAATAQGVKSKIRPGVAPRVPWKTRGRPGGAKAFPALATAEESVFEVGSGESACLGWPQPFMSIGRYLEIVLTVSGVEQYQIPADRPLLIDCKLRDFKPQKISVGVPSELQPLIPSRKMEFTFSRHGDRIVALVDIPAIGGSGGLQILKQMNAKAGSSSIISPATSPPATPSPPPPPNPWVEMVSNEVYRFEVKLSQLGISLISEKLKEEILFAETSNIHAIFSSCRDGNSEQVAITISDIQIDSQLERSEKPVLLANRATPIVAPELGSLSIAASSPSSQASAISPASGKAASGGDISRTTSMTPSILTPGQPLSGGFRPFLQMVLRRPRVGGRDNTFHTVSIRFDDLEFDLDAEMFNALQDFYNECLKSLGYSLTSRGIERGEIEAIWTTTPITENYVPPSGAHFVVMEKVFVSEFTVHTWISFLLEKLPFLGDGAILLLRLVMASNRLELKGAPIKFTQQQLGSADMPLRGSVATLANLVLQNYASQIMNSLAVILGYSSLVNIPRFPLEVLRNTFDASLTAAGSVSQALGSLWSNLAFDNDYKRQREKAVARDANTTQGIKEGFAAASKNLGEGVSALGNVITKPLEGARKEGFSGFIRGFGKGVVGSLVKPVDKMGMAISNVASGIKAEYITKNQEQGKLRRFRRRQPRMLWGEQGYIVDYNARDSELRANLGLRFGRNVTGCLLINTGIPNANKAALIFYPKRIAFTELKGIGGDMRDFQNRLDEQLGGNNSNSPMPLSSSSSSAGRSNNNGSASLERSGSIFKREHFQQQISISSQQHQGAILIQPWTVDAIDISSVRASSWGVVIQTAPDRSDCQIPCSSAKSIREILREIESFRRHHDSFLIVGGSGSAGLNDHRVFENPL